MVMAIPMLLSVLGAGLFFVLLYTGRGFWAWVTAAALWLAAWAAAGMESAWLFWSLTALVAVLATLFGPTPLRRTHTSP